MDAKIPLQAGSERIGKSGVVGNLATEAKYV
jgi:hypothetical protein